MPPYIPNTTSKSMDDLAAMMAENTMKMRGLETDEATDESAAPEPDINTSDSKSVPNQGESDGEPERAEPAPAAADDDTPDEPVEVEAAEEEATPDTPEVEDRPFELDEDTVFDLGEGKEVTFKELARVYEADTTIAEQVATQSEATTAALAARAKAEEDSNKMHTAMTSVLQHLDGIISQPMVSKPDANLRTSNAEQYLQHLEAYEADQLRIKDTREQFLGSMSQFEQQQQEQLEQRRAQELQALNTKLPALQNPETRKAASEDILSSASHYGFTEQELKGAVDHRLYQMAYDAEQYRKIMAKSGKKVEGVLKAVTEKTVKPTRTRVMRSQGTRAASTQTAAAKKVTVLRKQAKKSGHVDDVAALIAAKRSK